MACRDEHAPTLRVLNILEAVASSENGCLSLTEISDMTCCSKSTLFPIVYTLVARGYLQKKDNSYCLGLKTVSLGVNFLNQDTTLGEMRQIIHNMVLVVAETGHLAILDEGNVLYLYKEDAQQSIRMNSSIGKRIPAYGTALGKALLSECSMSELKHLYPNGLVPLTKNTITDFDVLKAQLEKVVATGFAYEYEESNQMINCVAVPIRSRNKVVAAISIAIPTFRLEENKFDICRKALTTARSSIENLLDYTGYVFQNSVLM